MRHVVIAAIAMLSVSALAGPPSPAGAAAPGARREEIRERVQGKIQTYVTTELSTRIGLDASKSAKLADSVKAHMERKRERAKNTREQMQKLHGLMDQNASDAQVKAQLDAVLGASSRDDDVALFMNDTAKFLTVKEQAKLALALPDVLKDMRKMMREARKGMRRGPGGFGGKPGNPDEE